MPHRGRFVVFEGGEGAGKSTQARLLADRLGARLTREPGGTALGERLRGLLLDPELRDLDPRAELLLMVAARAQHVGRVVAPALEAGSDVVCDRFSGSTLAYQGYGRGLPLGDVAAACALAGQGVVPDVTVLLDVAPLVARHRRAAEGGRTRTDRIEAAGEAFHARVRAGFLEIAAGAGWVVVDGSGSVEEVAAAVADAVGHVIGALTAPRGLRDGEPVP